MSRYTLDTSEPTKASVSLVNLTVAYELYRGGLCLSVGSEPDRYLGGKPGWSKLTLGRGVSPAPVSVRVLVQ